MTWQKALLLARMIIYVILILETLYLVVLRKGADVVLKGVRHPAILDPDIAHTLQGVPEVVPRAHRAVQKLVKVLVVAEDDMATHVEQEPFWGDICACQATSFYCLQPRCDF